MREQPIIFMFSGQGSHYYQMGRELFEQHPVFKRYLLQLDDTAQDLLGRSVVANMYGDANKGMDMWDDILTTHPAIFMVEYALAKTLMDSGIRPDYVLGASMGVFAAATVAGNLTAEQALTAVIKQAQLLEELCEEGGMMAILDRPALYREQPKLFEYSDLAGINFDQHFVISTGTDRLKEISCFLGKNTTYQNLAVSRAFHSSWIDPIESDYLKFIASQAITYTEIPHICCVDSTILDDIHSHYFWNAVRKPVNFQNTIAFLETQGSYRYIDLGPSGTLATFLKYNLTPSSSSQTYSVMTPYKGEVEKLKKIFELRLAFTSQRSETET